MSKSYRDQRGKRTNSEIGHSATLVEDKVVSDKDWAPTRSPEGKRHAKRLTRRLRRRINRIHRLKEI